MKNNKHLLFLIIAFFCLVGLATGVYALKSAHKPVTQTAQTKKIDPNINLEPSTQTDKDAAASNKQAILDHQAELDKQIATQSAGSKKTVTPVITYADEYQGQVEVGASVPVFENDGTCTANFTNGSTIVTKTVKAVADVNKTACPAMTADSSEFTKKGRWTVTINYSSTSSAGVSASKVIEIQ